jgi:hypothetical protein
VVLDDTGVREWLSRAKSSVLQVMCRWHPTAGTEGAGRDAASGNHSDGQSGWCDEGFGGKNRGEIKWLVHGLRRRELMVTGR